MKFPKKIERYFKSLEQFQEFCTDDVNQFIGILKPMLYKENDISLTIEVGRKIDNGFLSLLSATVNKFSIMLDCFNDDICFIIKDNAVVGNKTMTMFNLNMVNNISIKTIKQTNVVTYNIYFSYGSVDYHLKITQ